MMIRNLLGSYHCIFSLSLLEGLDAFDVLTRIAELKTENKSTANGEWKSRNHGLCPSTIERNQSPWSLYLETDSNSLQVLFLLVL
jgi:hypothetical protein